MKLTRAEQLRLSVKLAELVGWRNVRQLGGDVVGERRGLRLLIPNYFDRDSQAAKAELISFVCSASLHTKTHFLQALDRAATGGAVYDAMFRNGVLSVAELFALLDATPAAVANALVEVEQLADESQSLGVAA